MQGERSSVAVKSGVKSFEDNRNYWKQLLEQSVGKRGQRTVASQVEKWLKRKFNHLLWMTWPGGTARPKCRSGELVQFSMRDAGSKHRPLHGLKPKTTRACMFQDQHQFLICWCILAQLVNRDCQVSCAICQAWTTEKKSWKIHMQNSCVCCLWCPSVPLELLMFRCQKRRGTWSTCKSCNWVF